jgi:hypothetical protein
MNTQNCGDEGEDEISYKIVYFLEISAINSALPSAATNPSVDSSHSHFALCSFSSSTK